MSLEDASEFLKLANVRDLWILKNKLAAEGLTGTRIDDSYSRLRNHLIVGMAANRIAKMLGKKHLIATTRIRTGLKGNLLHPIATWPSQLSSFILDGGNHSEFSFDTNALNGGGGEELVNAPADWRGMEHDLSTPDDRKTPFTRHIDASLSFARESPEDYGLDAAELEELQQRGTCLVIGGFKNGVEFVPPRSSNEEFHYFFELYIFPRRSSGKDKIPTTADRAHEIGTMLAGMFRAPEFSKHDDMEDFELDGLLLVSKLIPTLTDQNTAPSDAVAYFFRRMEGILRKHTLGTDNRHTWLRFVAINTVFDQTGDTYTPRFHIFPHKDTSGEKAINAFLLSHPKRRATVKLMIFLWARARNSEVSDEFKQFFEDYEHGEVVYDAENQCIYFSEHDDPELWEQVNLDISPHGQKTRCTLGPVDSYRSPMMAPTRNSMAM